MHPIQNGYFIGGSICYLVIQYLRYQNISIPIFINSYATDLLFMPLLLLFSLWLMRIIKRNPQLILSLAMLLTVFVYISVVFEVYLPQKSTIYVQDKVDVLMYFLGTVSFYFLQKKLV